MCHFLAALVLLKVRRCCTHMNASDREHMDGEGSWSPESEDTACYTCDRRRGLHTSKRPGYTFHCCILRCHLCGRLAFIARWPYDTKHGGNLICCARVIHKTSQSMGARVPFSSVQGGWPALLHEVLVSLAILAIGLAMTALPLAVGLMPSGTPNLQAKSYEDSPCGHLWQMVVAFTRPATIWEDDSP